MVDAAPPAPAARPPLAETGYWAALFAVLGPPIGAVIPVIALLVSALSGIGGGLLAVAVVLLTALPVCYLFGLVPGAVTGAAGSYIAARIGDRRAVAAATALVGAATSALWALLISGFSEFDGWILGWIALAGALAGAACAWLATAHGRRPALEAEAADETA